MQPRPLAVTVDAPAKINLALHVVGQRADGYHELQSLVAFAAPPLSDALTIRFGEPDRGPPALSVTGPFAAEVPLGETNAAVRAALAVGGIAALSLDKRLPVAAGIGGGSADAAAVLRAALWRSGRAAQDVRDLSLSLGADVPVCLLGRTCMMAGIGERLAPLRVPQMAVVLANPGVPVSTGEVFARLTRRNNAPLPAPGELATTAALVGYLAGARNDLEPAAVAIAPAIAAVLQELRRLEGCRLARMSGSGATVFGLFDEAGEGEAAARNLRARGWWAEAGSLSAAPSPPRGLTNPAFAGSN